MPVYWPSGAQGATGPPGPTGATGPQGPAGAAGGALVLLAEQTASASASLNFTVRNVAGQSGAIFQSDYDVYEIRIVKLVAVTDATQFNLLMSTNGGSTYDGSAIYDSCNQNCWVNSSSGGGFTNQTSMNIGGTSNDANYGQNGTFTIYSPGGSGYKIVLGDIVEKDSSKGLLRQMNGFVYRNSAAVNAFQINYSSGNIASGTVRVYGVAK